MSELELPQDHFVSRGFQQNFASDDKRVAILNVRAGHVTDRRRPIKSNFRERGFTTFLEAGVPNDLLEKAFCSIESRVLNEIRDIGVHRQGPQQKEDVANLFAVHLVRSPAFKAFHTYISERFRAEDVPAFATRADVIERVAAATGRAPAAEELLEVSLRAYDDMVSTPRHVVDTMLRQRAAMTEMLGRFHLQIVEVSEGLPGFAIGDTPIVHALLKEGRYGFRTHLALGDADFIVGPLTRRTAACFTATPLPPVQVRTRKKLDAINAVFIRSALEEVACHPDDAKALQQTYLRLDRLPPALLTGQ